MTPGSSSLVVDRYFQCGLVGHTFLNWSLGGRLVGCLEPPGTTGSSTHVTAAYGSTREAHEHLQSFPCAEKQWITPPPPPGGRARLLDSPGRGEYPATPSYLSQTESEAPSSASVARDQHHPVYSSISALLHQHHRHMYTMVHRPVF